MPPELGNLGEFADDLGRVVLNLFDAMFCMAPVFDDMAAVASLSIDSHKSEILYYGMGICPTY